MEPMLVRVLDRRFQIWVPLVLGFGFVLLAALPVSAGGGEQSVAASMYVSRTQASPGDNVTFWIWIHPLKEKGRSLVVTESPLDGLAVVSSVAPGSCLETSSSWVCVQGDARPFAIEVHAVVLPGTEGRDLVNNAQVAIWDRNEHHDDEERHVADTVGVSAEVHVVPVAVIEEPDIVVQLISTQPEIVPGTLLNYQVEVTNRGNSTANNVSVIVSMPASIVLLSASRWPTQREGQLTWILDSVPVGSTELQFNATVPASNRPEQVDLGVVVTYDDGNGGQVRVETRPSSISILPVPPAAFPVSPVQVGIVVAVLAFVGRAVFLPPGPIRFSLSRGSGADEIFLLHRSGLLLKHFSPTPTRDADTDIVGGMLAAVRMFVEDSMNPSAGSLQEIRFSGGSIVFVTGEHAALAAVNAKGNRARFAHRAMGLLRKFEGVNGDALSNFDGVAERLDGVDDLFTRIAA